MIIECLQETGNPLPRHMTHGAAGVDLMSSRNMMVVPDEIMKVPTGLKVALPHNTFLDIRQRSGLSLKYPNYIVNSPGTIDSDYRGELFVTVINRSPHVWKIKVGDRIAQAILMPYIRQEWNRREALPITDRGEGGYGHTGT